jgi:hypothetical protein
MKVSTFDLLFRVRLEFEERNKKKEEKEIKALDAWKKMKDPGFQHSGDSLLS